MRHWFLSILEDVFLFQSRKCNKVTEKLKRYYKDKQMKVAFNQQWVFTLRIIAVCLVWYGSSSTQSIMNKLTLQHYPYPLTVTLSSLVNNAIFAVPLAKIMNVKFQTVPTKYLMRMIIPIAFGKTLALASSFFGLWKIPVSYAQTVKATLPIFTVFTSRILLHERQPFKVYVSLLPIVIGVVTASLTEISFSTIGLIASLFSTFINSCINVSIKKVFDDTGMHPISLLNLTSQIAAVILFPVWILQDGVNIASGFMSPKPENELPDFYFVFLLLGSGLSSFLQNLCSFILIHQLTTLSFAVSNAAKRVAVIVISLFVFKNPVTPLNCFGMLLSILGMFVYNRIKHPSNNNIKKERPPLLKLDSNNLGLSHFTTSDSDARLISIDA